MLNTSTKFVSIPVLLGNFAHKEFLKYTPIILMDGEYKDDFGVSVSKAVYLEPLRNKNAALKAARIACLSTEGAIGYAVRGEYYE